MYQKIKNTALRCNGGRDHSNAACPKSLTSKRNFLMTATLLLIFGAFMQSCCVLMPNFNTKDVKVSVTPSNADILYSNGKKAGTGTCNLHFDCKDKKDARYQLTLQASGYRTQTVNVYKSDYSRNFTLAKKVNTNVNVSVTPSNANILYKNGNKAGTGSCTLSFDEDDASNSYFELTLEAPNYYSQTVKVYKSDNSKSFTLQRKPIKTVVVIPAEADIFVNNEKVSKGKYDVSFENRDKVILTFKCIGFEEATYTLLKSNTEQTVTYTLDVDEAYENSIGGETAAQYANKWVPITVRQGLNEDEVWMRMISIVRENFEQMEKTDKSSGWIKTFPAITPYKASDVRTVLEIAPDYSTGTLKYKVRLSFEKRKKGSGDEGWVKYDRLMKIYKDVIPNLLNSVGGGM
ncbi:MAG: hypothetical protein FWC39_13570 [Bacteroidetes bacterium]|nr:hypothetical protein [Bacteroidota bacterium]